MKNDKEMKNCFLDSIIVIFRVKNTKRRVIDYKSSIKFKNNDRFNPDPVFLLIGSIGREIACASAQT